MASKNTSLTEDESEAVIWTTSYHRADFDKAVICFLPGENATTTKPFLSTDRPNTGSSLGSLDVLPLELIDAVCLELDLASVFAFRHASLRGKQVVNALGAFKAAISHAPDAVCALFRTGLAPSVTLSDFYIVLCEQKCSECWSNYGDLVHLLVWDRCCSACVRASDWTLRVTCLSRAKQELKPFQKRTMSGLRIMRSLSGFYSMEEKFRRKRNVLLSASGAIRAWQRDNNGAEDKLGSLLPDECFDYMACCAMPYFDPVSKKVQHGVSCAGCQVAVEKGCYKDDLGRSTIELRDAVYSEEGYLTHFQSCRYAQELWSSSNHGKVEPPDWPHGCRRGGYFASRDET